MQQEKKKIREVKKEDEKEGKYRKVQVETKKCRRSRTLHRVLGQAL